MRQHKVIIITCAMNKKSYTNRKSTELQLPHCGYSPQAEKYSITLNDLKQHNKVFVSPDGLICYDFTHKFNNCNDAICEICKCYKNIDIDHYAKNKKENYSYSICNSNMVYATTMANKIH